MWNRAAGAATIHPRYIFWFHIMMMIIVLLIMLMAMIVKLLLNSIFLWVTEGSYKHLLIPPYDDDDADDADDDEDEFADEIDVELDQKADVAMQCFMTRPVCEISLNTDNATYFWCGDGSCDTKNIEYDQIFIKSTALARKSFLTLLWMTAHIRIFLNYTRIPQVIKNIGHSQGSYWSFLVTIVGKWIIVTNVVARYLSTQI